MTMLRTPLLGLGVLLLCAAPVHAADKYYKWVDAQGTTHYTQTPPPASKARKVLKTVTVSRHVNGSSVPGYAPQTPAVAANSAAPAPASAATPAPTQATAPAAGPAPVASLTPAPSGNPVAPGSTAVAEGATGNNVALSPSDARPE